MIFERSKDVPKEPDKCSLIYLWWCSKYSTIIASHRPQHPMSGSKRLSSSTGFFTCIGHQELYSKDSFGIPWFSTNIISVFHGISFRATSFSWPVAPQKKKKPCALGSTIRRWTSSWTDFVGKWISWPTVRASPTVRSPQRPVGTQPDKILGVELAARGGSETTHVRYVFL